MSTSSVCDVQLQKVCQHFLLHGSTASNKYILTIFTTCDDVSEKMKSPF